MLRLNIFDFWFDLELVGSGVGIGLGLCQWGSRYACFVAIVIDVASWWVRIGWVRGGTVGVRWRRRGVVRRFSGLGLLSCTNSDDDILLVILYYKPNILNPREYISTPKYLYNNITHKITNTSKHPIPIYNKNNKPIKECSLKHHHPVPLNTCTLSP